MQRNIHPADRCLRLAAGVASLSSAVYGRRQSALTRALLAGFGAMKIAEALTGFCPIKSSMERIGNPGGTSMQAPEWTQQAAEGAKQVARQAADKVQNLAQQAVQGAEQASDIPIPDEVADFLVDSSKRETSDEDNA